MSVHGDLCQVLNDAAVAPGGAHPEFLDQDSQATEYVIVRRVSTDPQMMLGGYSGITHDVFVFECWSTSKARAIAITDNVVAAVEAQTTYPMRQREQPSANEDFTPDVMEVMEPVQFSIWRP